MAMRQAPPSHHRASLRAPQFIHPGQCLEIAPDIVLVTGRTRQGPAPCLTLVAAYLSHPGQRLRLDLARDGAPVLAEDQGPSSHCSSTVRARPWEVAAEAAQARPWASASSAVGK